MKHNFSKTGMSGIVYVLGFLTFLLIINGCASYVYLLKGENQKTFTTTETSYDKAFSSAIRTATEMGYSIFTSDKDSGTFYASKGSLFGERSELNFLLLKEATDSSLSFNLRVKSSKGSESVMKEFVDHYGKYVTVTP